MFKKFEIGSETCTSLKLKHLNICLCCFLEELDIRQAENLLSFERMGRQINDPAFA